MAGWRGQGRRIEVGESIQNEQVISHYQDHGVTHKLYLRQAKKTTIPNWDLKIETNMDGPMGDQNITTPSVVKPGESRIIAQAPAPGPRGEISDFIICVDYEANLLHKAVGNKEEQLISSLNNTEQQVGCLMVDDEKEATRIDNHNNTSQAPCDTRVQNNSGIAGGKVIAQLRYRRRKSNSAGEEN